MGRPAPNRYVEYIGRFVNVLGEEELLVLAKRVGETLEATHYQRLSQRQMTRKTIVAGRIALNRMSKVYLLGR